MEKHWKTELEQQGRDYAAAIRNAHRMRKAGLKNVAVRMSDKVDFVTSEITAKVKGALGIRCHRNNWYMLLVMDHTDGEPHSDHDENSEAVFMNMEEAIKRDDITHMTKVALRALLDEPDQRDRLLYPN